ncbi:cytochrome P460 family protein [Minwuia sp.]|uniref:cytochrome P460 family protein n=1 Tax=Minwuia sp. TaxID=2493630 RepID=UPI003A8C935D
MWAGYAKSGLTSAERYHGWANVAARPYPSATHGGRLVNNYVNATGASNYGRFEDAGPARVGTVLAKDSFTVNAAGKAGPGPLFLMEKMPQGFNADTADWNYIIVMPNGAVGGATGGKNSANVQFCHDCHVAVSDQDHMFFLPEEFRAK